MKKRIEMSVVMTALIVAAVVSFTVYPSAQLSPSGNKVQIDQTTVGTTNAVSLAQVGATTTATGNGVVGTGVQRVAIASDNTAFTVNAAQSGTWTIQPGNTANTTAWFVKNVPSNTCGTTAVSQALAAVPTSSTAIWASTTCVDTIAFSNTNATAQTVTLTDNAGTPIIFLNGFSIPGLSTYTFEGGLAPFTSGVKWAAGGSGVTGFGRGFQ